VIVVEIVDTVYLIAYLKPSDPLHTRAVEIIESLGNHRKVSQASLVELDLLMKSRGFTVDERLKTWVLLEKIISTEAIEPVNPQDLAIAVILAEKHMLDYFDAIIAAQCITRNAKPLTTDKEIIEVVSKESKEKLVKEWKITP